jgi:chromosome partitioning protein
MMAKTIAIWHHKGGVGKSTLTHNLGCHLAQMGKSTLLVGINSQATLERFAGVPEPDNLTETIAHAIERTAREQPSNPPIYGLSNVMQELRGSLHRSVREQCDKIGESLFLSPCNSYLNQVELMLSGVDLREWKLAETLEPIEDDFDFCLVDCPGEGNLSTTMALVASNYVLVPIQTAKTSYDNLPLTMRKIKAIQRSTRT